MLTSFESSEHWGTSPVSGRARQIGLKGKNFLFWQHAKYHKVIAHCTGSVGTWSETWFVKLTSFKPIILAIFHDKQTLANIYFLTFFSNTTDFRRKFSMAFVKKTILFILRVFSWCNNLTRVDAHNYINRWQNEKVRCIYKVALPQWRIS